MSERYPGLTLFADTDCDITPEMAAEWGYTLIPMPYTLDGAEVFPYRDGAPLDIQAFYHRLREGATPKTSGLSPADYIALFEPVLQRGDDILYPHFSARLSSTFNAMRIAIETLRNRYPDRQIVTLDTKAITGMALCILEEIAHLAQVGTTLQEIVRIAQAELIPHFAFFAYATDLQFFRRSGRLSGLSAFVGGALGVRPIISIDDEGHMGAIDKAVGTRAALAKIHRAMSTLGEDMAQHPLYIVHSDARQEAEELAAAIRERYGVEAKIIWINPTAGVHCGPGCLGVAFHAGRRSL